MKNTLLMSTLAAAIVAGAASQGLAEGKDHRMGPGHRPPSFEQLDANGDGKLTPEEIKRHMQARFAEADADGDGKITRQEMSDRIAARQAERRERMLDRMFNWRDLDGDGALSMDEMRDGRGLEMFARADEDGDGAVSREEFERMRKMHDRHHRGEHRPGKGHRPPMDLED